MRLFSRAALAAVAFLAAGCATSNSQNRALGPSAQEEALLQEIRKSAEAIRLAMEETKRLEAAGRNHANWAYSDYPEGRVPGGLDQPVTAKWYGDAVPLVQTLARQARYTFVETGQRPIAPLIVRVEGSSTVGMFLRDVGRQLGSRALIIVDAGLERVEIVYGAGE